MKQVSGRVLKLQETGYRENKAKHRFGDGKNSKPRLNI
jgi:hypothetical protein